MTIPKTASMRPVQPHARGTYVKRTSVTPTYAAAEKVSEAPVKPNEPVQPKFLKPSTPTEQKKPRVVYTRSEPIPRSGISGDLWKDLGPLYNRTGWPVFLKMTKVPLKDLIEYEAEKLRVNSAHETMMCVEMNDKGGSAKSVTNAANLTTFGLITQQPTFGVDFDAKRSGNLLALLGMDSGTLSVEDLLADPTPLRSYPYMLKPPNGGKIGQHRANGLRSVRALRFSHLPPDITGGSRYEGSVLNSEFDFDSALEIQCAPDDYRYIDSDEARKEPPKERIENLLHSIKMLSTYVGVDMGNALLSRWLRVAVEMSDICDISIVPTVPSSEESGANTLNTLRLMYPDISRRSTITVHGYKGNKPQELAERYARIYRLPIGHISIVPHDSFFVNHSDGTDVRAKLVVDPREIKLRTYYVTIQRLNRQFEIKKAYKDYVASQASNTRTQTPTGNL